MNRYTSILLFPLFLFCGCSDQSSRPSDLPPLFPCTVLILQDGKPLEGAFVEFHAVTEQKYQPAAFTDASGNAVILTYGFSGVPSGTYKVTVIRNIDDDHVYRTDADGEQALVSYNIYKTVEDLYSSVETTPFEIEVISKRVQETFDVGKAIKVLLRRGGG